MIVAYSFGYLYEKVAIFYRRVTYSSKELNRCLTSFRIKLFIIRKKGLYWRKPTSYGFEIDEKIKMNYFFFLTLLCKHISKQSRHFDRNETRQQKDYYVV